MSPRSKTLTTSFLLFSLVAILSCLLLPVESLDYLARYQPELENVTLDSYIKNESLFNIQVQCLLEDGPCDIVGRFLKPRIARGLLGECILCTPRQAITLNKLLRYIQEERPELYRLAVAKYLQNSGIQLPADEAEKVIELEKKEKLGSLN